MAVKEGRKTCSVSVPIKLYIQVKKLADVEVRTVSNMLAVLVREAVKTRRESEESG